MRTWEDKAREEMYRRMALADDALRAYNKNKITKLNFQVNYNENKKI